MGYLREHASELSLLPDLVIPPKKVPAERSALSFVSVHADADSAEEDLALTADVPAQHTFLLIELLLATMLSLCASNSRTIYIPPLKPSAPPNNLVLDDAKAAPDGYFPI